jgi:Heterogeneous nuclear ribonucleoprotein Q acidic domain
MHTFSCCRRKVDCVDIQSFLFLPASVVACDAMACRLIKAKELDAFELRALDKFSAEDAVKILERFAEADLRKVI